MTCARCKHDKTEHAFKVYAHPNAKVHDKRCMATSCPCRCFQRSLTVNKLAQLMAMYQAEGMGEFEIHLSIIQKDTKRVWARAGTQAAMAHGMRDGGAVLIMGVEFNET